MRTQLYVGKTAPNPAAFVAVENQRFVKPHGGLWTSTYLGPERGSDWVRWDRGKRMGWTDHDGWWLLRPPRSARVLLIDSMADLRAAFARYPRVAAWGDGYRDNGLDFETIAADFDAIHLTERGQERTRFFAVWGPGVDYKRDKLDLYGWDCESTLWLRWVFTRPPEHVPPSPGPRGDPPA